MRKKIKKIDLWHIVYADGVVVGAFKNERRAKEWKNNFVSRIHNGDLICVSCRALLGWRNIKELEKYNKEYPRKEIIDLINILKGEIDG